MCKSCKSLQHGFCEVFYISGDGILWYDAIIFPQFWPCQCRMWGILVQVNGFITTSGCPIFVRGCWPVACSANVSVGISGEHCSHVSTLLLLLHRFVWELWGNSRIWCLIISNYYINILIGAINIFRLTHHVTWRSSGLGAEVSIGFSVSQGLVIAWLFRIRVWFWG